MNLAEEVARLERRLAALRAEPDGALAARYRLEGSVLPATPYWLLRRLAAAALRRWRRLRLGRAAAWPVRLKHMPGNADARALLIWAIDTDRETLHAACQGLARIAARLPELAPVLVTNVADFAFYSRLGWLVEFLPAIEGHGEPYQARKARLMARLYADAPILPVEAGLVAEQRADEILRLVRGT